MLRGQQFLELPFGYYQRNNKNQEEQKQKKYKTSINGMKNNNKIDDLLKQHNIQFIEINTTLHQFDRLILQSHIRFYCKSDTYIKNEQIETIQGKCYRTSFDSNNNPKYVIQEGNFRINITNQNQEYILNGQGIEYLGKSEMIRNQGIFIEGVFQEDLDGKKKKKQDIIQENKESRRANIIIMDQSNQIIKIRSQDDDNQQFNEIYKGNRILYNQSISDRDYNIVRHNSKEWLNSSLIDSYVEYLNQISEQQIYSFGLERINKIKRILFIPSHVTTSFGLCEEMKTYRKKVEGLLSIELLFYKELNYDMKQVYTKIGFPININKRHWVFLLFNLKKEIVLLYDSLKSTQKKKFIQNQMCQAIAKFLKLKIREWDVNNQFQQQDSYSCGYHVCSFMKYQYQLQFEQNCKFSYDENKMKKEIAELIKY